MASQNISFASIPSSIRKPGKYAEFNTALAVRTLPGNLQKMCILGQRMAAGSVPANTLVDVFSDVDAATYFGRGSIAHLMVRAALQANPYLTLSAITVDDAGAGVAATGTDTLAGTATAAGVVTLNVGDVPVQVAVAVGDTAATVAANLNAQIAAQPDLPLTAAVVGAVVTRTAKNKGTLGNGMTISSSSTAAGITITSTAMGGGATDPTISTILSTIFTAGHNILASAWNDSTTLATLRTHLDTVGNALEKRGALGVFGHKGTLGASTTLANSINSGRICGMLVPTAFENSYEIGAAFAAVIASEEDPAQPLNLLPLTGIAANPIANRLSRTEQENALNNGMGPSEVGPGDVVQIVRAISTYTRDPQAVTDISLLDITTIRSLDYTRKALVDRISLRFPRSKRSKRVLKQIREEVFDVMYKLEELEILENVKENEDGVLVELDLQDPNRVDIRIPADVVNGLHVVAMRIDLLL